MLLDLYYNGDASNPGYSIYEFSFGNLASTIRVIPPVRSDYLSFSFPTNTYHAQRSSRFQWDFLNVAGGSTNYTSYRENEQSPNHVQIDEFQWTGNWEILATSEACGLVRNTGNSSYVLYWYASNGTASSVSNTYDLTALGLSASAWAVSSDCRKIRAGTSYYALNGAAYQLVAGTSGIVSADLNMDYGVTANSVVRYNSNSGQFESFYSGLTLSPAAKVAAYSGRVLVSDTSSTAASVYAFLDSTGTASLLLEFSTSALLNYTSAPSVLFSSQCTKVLVHGISGGVFAPYFFHVDYAGLSYTELDFPTASVSVLPDPSLSFLSLEDNWVYVRQLTGAGSQEIVYAIVADTVPVEANRRNISSSDLSCDQYKMRVIANGTLYVLTQCSNVTASPVVKLWQLVPTQTSGGSAAEEMGMSQVVIEGMIKLCAPGCSDCSTGVCAACNDGYVFDSDSAVCYLCPPGCSACSVSNPNACSACLSGSFLSGTSCLLCDATCTSCSGSATSCQSCLPGEYYNGTSCASCPRNCLNCTSAVSCSACQQGFVVSSGTCRKCSQQCSSCEADNITKCTSCSAYLYLSSGTCLTCPSRCQKCNGNICAKCDSGYHPAADGSCV